MCPRMLLQLRRSISVFLLVDVLGYALTRDLGCFSADTNLLYLGLHVNKFMSQRDSDYKT
ncbi:hypothetical protein Plhal304r1_c032g0102171 [Plasmopara halstedii]